MTTIKDHAGNHISAADYLAPYLGTAAESMHRFAVSLGLTLRAQQAATVWPVYTVDADAITGEWIGEPVATGETTSAYDWFQRSDTPSEYHSTFEHEGETRAIVLRLI